MLLFTYSAYLVHLKCLLEESEPESAQIFNYKM